jgi:hypothetical protein
MSDGVVPSMAGGRGLVYSPSMARGAHRVSVSDQLHMELDQMRRDIAEKDHQIARLQSRVEHLAPY